ncbi:MAG: hypothetical protein LBV71_16790 [Prevotella sp.]|jgi:hypothetical protein|nr:hypothetical protein [Prevotella sp.]
MIKRLLLLSLITFLANSCLAQKNNMQEDCSHYYDKTTGRNVYISFTSAPISPDSIPEGYLNYIYRNIKISVDDLIYHSAIRPKYKIIMDEKGKIIKCTPLFNGKEKNILDFTVLDKEIIRIFEESENWTPAKCKDRNIATQAIVVVKRPHLK